MASVTSGATRDAFGEKLLELGEKIPNLVVLDADLEGSTRTKAFMKKYPERHFQFGIAEHNMIGAAGGLALEGKIPVATSFATFLIGRLEAVRVAVAYNQANVKMVGTHAGCGIGDDGPSQMALEDVAAARALAGVVVLQPADRLETLQAVEWMIRHAGPVYIRLTRQDVDQVHDEGYSFKFGKVDVVHAPAAAHQQAVVFASGGTVGGAVRAAKALAVRGFAVKVVNVHTLQPFDAAGTAALAKSAGRVVTVEDHSPYGGLGSAVAEALAGAGLGVPLVRLGVKDFPESGTGAELYDKYGISSSHIEEACLRNLG